MPEKLPANIVCIGMAGTKISAHPFSRSSAPNKLRTGSGKTTFMQRLNAHLHGIKEPPYIINLDPAVKNVPFDRNIDIRDSVNYREVMTQYNLGPNGGIMTSLNLFATKIDQVIGILEKRAAAGAISRVLIDTPGQIECFVWSASGAIITDALASTFPTVIAYIIDTPRTAQPATFMANMLYACSILYKTKLPMILVFNKTDARDAGFAKEWMTDFEAFQTALRESENQGDEEAIGGSGYMGSLLNSMSLMLDEFYNHLDLVPVSAMTGAGIDDFLKAVEGKVEEYEREYKPEMEKARKRREEEKLKGKQKELDRLMKDLEMDKKKKEEPNVVSDVESDEEEEEGQGLVERDEDEEMEKGEDAEEGLKQRYERALRDSGGTQGSKMAEESLARYLRASNG
jgi:GTPase SAR1 family protein